MFHSNLSLDLLPAFVSGQEYANNDNDEQDDCDDEEGVLAVVWPLQLGGVARQGCAVAAAQRDHRNLVPSTKKGL